MYCTKCGKELQENEKECPYCSGAVEKEIGKVDEARSEKKILRVRLAIKIAALIAIVGFFLPMCTVSCYGEEVATVSGLNATIGMEACGESFGGNLLYALLLILPIGALWINLNRGDKSTYLESGVTTGVLGFVLLFLIRVFKNNVIYIEQQAGALLQVEISIVYYVILLCFWVLVIGGAYLTYRKLREKRENEGKIQSKIIIALIAVGKSLGFACIAIIVVMFLITSLGFENVLEPETMFQEHYESIEG